MASLTEVDRRSLEAVVASAHEAQSDAAALLALHTPDAVIVNIAGRRVLGREAFGQAMTAALATALSDVRTAVEVVDVRLATPDTAIVSCLKTVHDGRPGTHEQVPPRGALSYVLVRAGDGWRIALAQTTPIAEPEGQR